MIQAKTSRLTVLSTSSVLGSGIFTMLAFVVFVIWLSVFQAAPIVDALGMPRKTMLMLVIAVPLIPVFWLMSWNNSRLCLIVASGLIIFGDAFSAVCAPAILGATLPNCLNLMARLRLSKLRYLVSPLIVLGFLYFFVSFFLNFVGHSVQLTNRMQYDPGFPSLTLGWLGSLLGFTIVYPLIYFPFLLYDLSVHHPQFLKRFLVGLSVVMNCILLYGVLQFIQAHGEIRVSSIMRLPTRLGPFIVVYMTLLSVTLLEARGRLRIGYWTATLILSGIVLLMTQTRIAIGAAVVIAMLMLLALVASKSWMLVRRFIGCGLVLTVALGLLIALGKVDFMERFDSSQMESGKSSRNQIMKDYNAGINLQNVTPFQKTAHFLFGYGMFHERQLAHFNLHDTFACCLSVFGAVGLILYYTPYLMIAFVTLAHIFISYPLLLRPRFAMAFTAIFIFFLTGAYHNKLYSPIDTAYIWLIAGFILYRELPQLLGGKNAVNKTLP